MKNKKILTAISSLLLAATVSATALSGCQSKCEHVYRWTTETEATCTERGTERGVCGICGYVTTRKIEIDPDNHAYGEWEIEDPTQSEDGLATKICSRSASHKEEVILPMLTAGYQGYDFAEVTKAPTALEAGSLHLVLENEIEDVDFTVVLPRRELETVEDAVILGSSLGSLVRSTSGTMTDSDSPSGSTYWTFSADFGDNYTHVVNEGDQTESWFSLDDEGVPFGVYVIKIVDEDGSYYSDPAVMMNVTQKHLLGYGYSSGATGDNLRTFGAEDTLLSYYQRATEASEKGRAIKYSEDDFIKNNNGEVTTGFSYSYYENPFFARYHLEFTLYPSGAIKTLRLDTKIIRSYMIATSASGELLFDEDGDVIFAEQYEADKETGAPLYERDDKGNIVYEGYKTDSKGNELLDARGEKIPRPKPLSGKTLGWYSDDHEEVSNRVLIYNEQVLKTENDVVPENPYKSDVLYIRSFDVKYNNEVVGEEPVTVPSNTAVTFNFANIAPTTATLAYDPLSVYIRTDLRDIELTMNFSDNSYNIMGAYNKSTESVTVNSRYAGEIVLVFKTKSGKSEKAITVNFEKSAPSTINAQAYTYSDAGGVISYSWLTYKYTPPVAGEEDNDNGKAVIYVGQPLYIRAVADPSESGYADTGFNATCSSSSLNIQNDVDFEGEKVSLAIPSEAGEYRVYVQYKKISTDPDAQGFAQFVVKVVEAPEISGLLKGEYTSTLRYVKIGNDIRQEELKATFSYGNNWRVGTIRLDVGGNILEYSYTYDAESKQLAVTKTSGTDGETFDFTFAINEAYRLTVTHSTGFPGITETVALLPVVEQE